MAFTSIWTRLDLMIVPANSSVLAGARSVPVYVPAHALIILSGADYELAGTGRGSAGQRPNNIGDSDLDPGRPDGEKVLAYFNTAVFVRPPEGQFGNSGRTT